VPWAIPGVGAVATQSVAELSYGPAGLELVRSGKTPEQALTGLVAADPDSDLRQVAILAADGTAAVHTGAACIPEAGHRTGEGYSVQANMMRNDRVWPAMAEAFEAATAPLARRLLAALDAAEAAGGDWRGQQAAGLRVVPAEGLQWESVFDVRVDDHPEPLKELRRLLDLQEGYIALRDGERRSEAARAAGMAELDVRLAEIFDAAHTGNVGHAREILAPLLVEEPRWADYVRMLGRRGLIAHADELVG
jgi:uncharacterized Ntn-hydrolase superfamily protein